MNCTCTSIKSPLEWVIKSGARFRVQITLRDPRTGKVFDLTNYTVKSHFRLNQYDYSLPAQWPAVIDITAPTKGKFTLTLLPQTTMYMCGHGRGFFDVELHSTLDPTDIRRPLEGTWTAKLEVTIG